MSTKNEKQPLSVTHPELAKEADGWDPSLITQGSSKKLRWVCKQGHNWDAVIHSRTSRNDGCPYCSNRKIIAGFNDLGTTHPDLAREADEWDPSTVSAGSNKKYAWKCKEGHRWDAKLNNRSSKNFPIRAIRTAIIP